MSPDALGGKETRIIPNGSAGDPFTGQLTTEDRQDVDGSVVPAKGLPRIWSGAAQRPRAGIHDHRSRRGHGSPLSRGRRVHVCCRSPS